MTTEQGHPRALAAYRTASLQTGDPRQTLLLVHDAMRRDLVQAKTAYEEGALDRMCRHTEGCAHLVAALICKLDFNAAGTGGAALLRFYRDLQRRIISAPRQRDVSVALQSIADQIQMMIVEMSRNHQK